MPASILLGCIILGGFIYVSQVNKQKSIEKQQQIDLQAKAEQDKRDYIEKRKTECLVIYKTESDKFNNVESWQYIEHSADTSSFSQLFSKTLYHDDQCEIIYKDSKGNDFSKYF